MRMRIVIVCASLSGGCVSHRSIQLDPPTQAAMAEVGVEAAGRSVWLHVEGALGQEALGLRVYRDSVRWTTEAGERRAVQPAAVRRIEILSRPRGLAEGIVAGGAVGVLAGLVAAACCETPTDAWVPIGYAVGIAVGVIAVPIGGVIGFVRGHRWVYEPR